MVKCPGFARVAGMSKFRFDRRIKLIYTIFTKTRSRETKPGFQNRCNTAQATKIKALKRAKESKQNKTTVKQSLQGNVDWQFCSRGFTLSPVPFSGVCSFRSFLSVVSGFSTS